MSAGKTFAAAVLLLALAFGLYSGGLLSSSRVTDSAGLLSDVQEQRIDVFHRYLLADHDIDFRVLTAADVGDIDRYALTAFAKAGVGAHSGTGRGLLLVIDPRQDRLRVEVSRALEAVFPDAFIAYLEQRQMTPFFAAGRVAEGILATTELIVTRAQRAHTNAAWDDEPRAITMGGGAKTAARLNGQAFAKSRRPLDKKSAPLTSPQATLQAYIGAMRQRNDNPDLPVYSRASRTMLADWTVTAAQMDHSVASYQRCARHASRFRQREARAVIRYPPGARTCPPWFFVFEDRAWRLDLAVMRDLIRFGRDNSWRFASAGDRHPYAFAFADWRFDRNGFPKAERP